MKTPGLLRGIVVALVLNGANTAWSSSVPCVSEDKNLPYIAEGIGPDIPGSCFGYNDNDGSFTANAPGGAIAGTQDNFVFGAIKASGDKIIVARVNQYFNGGNSSIMGVMIRSSKYEYDRNALMAFTGNGLVFQSRTNDGQPTTFSTVPGILPPYWVKLEKRGNSIKGYSSPNGINWTQVGSAATINFGKEFYVGFATANEYNASFIGTSITTIGSGGFISKDIGNPGLAGSLIESNGTYTLQASGNDIYDTSDQFQYAYQQTSGDKAIIAKVNSISNTNSWAKAGVMIRTNLEKYSENGFMGISYSNGAFFQQRTLSGMTTSFTGQGGFSAPYWVKLEKRGNLVKGFRSSDGVTWSQVGPSMTIPLTTTYYVGLASTSHNNTVLGTSTFTNVQVQALPSDGFVSGDIGSPSLAGSYYVSNGIHTLTASGVDIYGTSDQFRFAYQKRKGDQILIAKVNSITNTSAWATAGIMVRTSLNANSRNAFLGIAPVAANGIAFQQRASEGAATAFQQYAGVTAPYWLKLEKRGSTIKAFRASDGINWVQVASTTVPCRAVAA